MERRLAITYIAAATTTFGVACVTIAITGGGLFASAATPKPVGATQVEIVDDYIVIHSSSTTIAPVDPAVVSVDIAAAPREQIARATGPVAAPAPAAGQTAVPQPTPGVLPSPEQQEAPAPGPSTASPSPEPGTTTAPAVSSTPSPSPAATVTPTAPPTAEAPAPAQAPTTPTTVPAARPPIPEGCRDPRFWNGTWSCDDD